MKPVDARDPIANPEIGEIVADALDVVSNPTDVIATLLLVAFSIAVAVFATRQIQRRIGEGFVRRTLMEYLATPVLTLAVMSIVGAFGGIFDNGLMNLAGVLVFLFCLVRLVGAVVELLFRPALALRMLLRLVTVMVWVVLVLGVFGERNPVISRFFSAKFTVGGSQLNTEGVISGIVFGVVIVIVAFWVNKVLEGVLRRSQTLQPNYALAATRIANVVVWMTALALIFSVSGINLAALAAFSGALGIGLGLGLQRLAASYISGLIVLFEQSVRVGDNISANGITGRVTRMTVRYTMIRTRDGIEAIVPNDSLTNNTIINQSWSDRNLRLSCGTLVKGDADTVLARQLLVSAAEAQTRVLRHPGPQAYVTGTTDKGIQLELFFWISDPENGQHNITSDIYDGALAAFKANGIALVAQ